MRPERAFTVLAYIIALVGMLLVVKGTCVAADPCDRRCQEKNEFGGFNFAFAANTCWKYEKEDCRFCVFGGCLKIIGPTLPNCTPHPTEDRRRASCSRQIDCQLKCVPPNLGDVVEATCTPYGDFITLTGEKRYICTAPAE